MSSGAQSTDEAFPIEAIKKGGYSAVFRGQIVERRCHSCGVGEPVLTRAVLPGDATDTQSRYIEAAVNGVLIGALYAPNGNPQPGPKFEYKLAWMKRLISHAAELCALDAPVVLQATLTLSPPKPTYIHRSPTRIMRSYSPNHARCSGSSWPRLG